MPLPDALSFETGAAISCGTGTAYGALKRLNLQGGETIAIFGQGPVGLSATQLAVAMGARVIALDVSPERCALAREFGAHEVIDARSQQSGRGDPRADPRRGRAQDARHLGRGRGARRRGARGANLGHGLLSSASAARSRSTSAPICCAGRSRWSAPGPSRPRARPTAPSSSPTMTSRSTSSSPTAGGSTRPRRPTGCSTRRPAARA